MIRKKEGGGRKTRSDKKIRLQPYFSKELHRKIHRLARSCDTSDHDLAATIVEIFFRHHELINYIQDLYGVSQDDPFRAVPIKSENGGYDLSE